MEGPPSPPPALSQETPATIAAPPTTSPRDSSGSLAGRFAFEITAITAGILIALAIGSVVERNRERALVRQARTAIGQEVAENRGAIERSIDDLGKQRRRLSDALRFADQMLKTERSEVTELSLSMSFPTLNQAAFNTADRTGAFAYMDYGEVRDLNDLYEVQDLVTTSQRHLLERLAGLLAIVNESGDPTKASHQDLEVFRGRLLDTLGAHYIHENLAKALLAQYRKKTGEAKQGG